MQYIKIILPIYLKNLCKRQLVLILSTQVHIILPVQQSPFLLYCYVLFKVLQTQRQKIFQKILLLNGFLNCLYCFVSFFFKILFFFVKNILAIFCLIIFCFYYQSIKFLLKKFELIQLIKIYIKILEFIPLCFIQVDNLLIFIQGQLVS